MQQLMQAPQPLQPQRAPLIVPAEINHEVYYTEGRIVLIEAPQRAGKTLFMSVAALDEYLQRRKPLLTNIAYESPATKQLRIPYRPLNFFELTMANIDTYVNTCITIDELNFYVNARAAMTKINRQFCSWLLQSKKMGITTYGTTHSLFYLDLVMRENFDYLVQPTTIYENVLDQNGDVIIGPDGKIKKRPAVLVAKWYNGPNQKHMRKTQVIDFRKKPQLLGLYNTRNVFNPFAQMEEYMEQQKLQKKLKQKEVKGRLHSLVPTFNPYTDNLFGEGVPTHGN